MSMISFIEIKCVSCIDIVGSEKESQTELASTDGLVCR